MNRAILMQRARPMRAAIIVAVVLVQGTATLDAETLYYSTWQGITTCSPPNGYVSHKSQWQGMTFGQDSDGNRWTTSPWQDSETTTVWPRSQR
jgi:hypothetical protein